VDGWPRHGLAALLAPDQANAVLGEGGYGLRVEEDRSEDGHLRLAGSGAGSGLPLGARPTWGDLYRALVRLRRTRARHDPRWLHHLTRLVDQSRPFECAQGGDWTPVAAHRVEWLTAPHDHPAQAEICATARRDLSTSDTRGLLFPTGSAALASGPSDAGIGWQLRTSGGTARLRKSDAQAQLAGWARVAGAVERDPVLRMHCATQPAPAALVRADTADAIVARFVEPAPAHPRHPGGTIVVGLPSLVSSPPRGLLHAVISNRFERREDELGYFLEHFVRPLLRVFRIALDTHRLGLFSLDESGVGVELSPELQATGRVVITEYGDVRPVDEVNADEVRDGVEALVSGIEGLTQAFTGLDFAGVAHAEYEVRSAVDRVIAEELRYLAPHTADLLSGDHPLRCFVHTVPAEQDDALKEVLHRVQEHTRRCRWNPELRRPAVVVDLDLCGIVPLQRTLDAARAVSGPRPGAPEGVLELGRPSSLRVLPTFAESTWHHFVALNGLDEKYPKVNWRQVHAEFFRAFARPWEKLRTDTVNAGLGRFVWDVQDAGGQVVFCTGRRERVRGYTEEVLARAGVPDAVLVCMPDDRTRPISEVKVEKLRELGDLEIVAVFDDLVANRIAISKEFSGAMPVAVEIPGLATERQPDQPVPDRAPVITTFETSPRRSPHRGAASGPSLSNTHSLEELQVGALRSNRLAHRWAVHLDADESLSIVDSLVSDLARRAERTADRARRRFGVVEGAASAGDHQERVLGALHQVFTRKQFLKGSRSNYQLDDLTRDVLPFLRQERPIEVVLLGFPVKQCLNRLKAFGPLPDLAELGALARLRELNDAVRAVHPPGLHFNVLTDGRHFRPRPQAITESYSRKLREYVALLGIEHCTTVEEIDVVAQERLGIDLPAERSVRLAHYRSALNEALRGFDIGDNPLRTLESINALAERIDGPDADAVGPALSLFRDMLMSVVYSVPLSIPAGVHRLTWSSLVYADVYNLTDDSVAPEVRHTRRAVLRRAWHTVIRYLATLRVDEELGYDELFPHRIRLTVSAAQRGRCGFTYLGGSGLLPWQGTGVVDARGQVAADFAISLLDQGFVPVYSPLIGPRQPWMMVPAEHARPHRPEGNRPGGVRLDEDFAAQIHLRRK
jgi:hypothetical protein